MNGRYHLISVAEDRMLMIWNLRDRSVAYRSSVLGAHPLRCVAAHPSLNRIAVGSDDGVVRFFSVSEASSRRPSTSARGSSSDTELVQCRHLYSFDAARVLRRERQTQESKHADSLATAATHAQQQVVDALPVWARASSPQAKPPAAEPVTPDAAEVSPCVLCVAFHTEASVSDDARGGDEEFDAQSFLAGVGDGSLGRPSSLKWRFVLCIVRFNTGTNPASQNRVCVRLATEWYCSKPSCWCLVATPSKLYCIDADSYNVVASIDPSTVPGFVGVPRCGLPVYSVTMVVVD